MSSPPLLLRNSLFNNTIGAAGMKAVQDAVKYQPPAVTYKPPPPALPPRKAQARLSGSAVAVAAERKTVWHVCHPHKQRSRCRRCCNHHCCQVGRVASVPNHPFGEYPKSYHVRVEFCNSYATGSNKATCSPNINIQKWYSFTPKVLLAVHWARFSLICLSFCWGKVVGLVCSKGTGNRSKRSRQS